MDSVEEDHNGDVLLLAYLLAVLQQDLRARLQARLRGQDRGAGRAMGLQSIPSGAQFAAGPPAPPAT